MATKTNNPSIYEYYEVNASFSNSLNFSKVIQKIKYYKTAAKTFGPDVTYRKIYSFYYNIYPNDVYRYLLIKMKKTDHTRYSTEESIIHINDPPVTGIELHKFGSLTIFDTLYIYSKNDIKNDDHTYFSISIENINKTILRQYDIYYFLEDYYDDRAFFKHSHYYQAVNLRLKDNKSTFYYKLSLYSKKNIFV